MKEDSLFSKIDHVGLVVRDIDKAIEYYQSLGIGPFEPPPNVASRERKVRGKPIPVDSIKVKEKSARIGPLLFQLIQPVEGESIWKEFLETRGEGVQHLGFIVDDIEKEEARLVAKGVEPVQTSRFIAGGGYTYFDTGRVGGVLTELIQWPPG